LAWSSEEEETGNGYDMGREKMKMAKITQVLSIFCVAITMISCTRVKEQLTYPNTEFKEYAFGKSNKILMTLPTPVLGEPYSFYSNYLRWEWIGAGFANYFHISNICIEEKAWWDENRFPQIISIELRIHNQNRFTLYREMYFGNGNKIVFIFTTATSSDMNMKYAQKTIDNFVSEDNELFEKIVRTIRIKKSDGKYLKLKVDYDMLRAKMHEIYFTSDRQPRKIFDIPYELVEDTTVQPPVPSKK